MYIYYLDKDPKKAALAHTDADVKAQCFQLARLLSVAHRRIMGDKKPNLAGLYRSPTFKKGRPGEIIDRSIPNSHIAWVMRAGGLSYEYTSKLLEALFEEHRNRFGKSHISEELMEALKEIPLYLVSTDMFFSPLKFTPPPVPTRFIDKTYWLTNGQVLTIDKDKLAALHTFRNWYANTNASNSFVAPTWFMSYLPRPQRVSGTPRTNGVYASVINYNRGSRTTTTTTRARWI